MRLVRLGRLLTAYVGLLVVLWLVVALGGDRWWPATILLFSPLWIVALPLPVFLVALVRARAGWRPWLVWCAGATVALFPLMGLCLPWSNVLGSGDGGVTVLTCNLGGGVDRAALRSTLRTIAPDVACFQECPHDLAEAFEEDWHVVRQGGLVLVSRSPLVTVHVLSRPLPVAPRTKAVCHVVRVASSNAIFHVATLHLESPRHGLASMTDSTTVLAPSHRATLVEQTRSRRLESRRVSTALAGIDGPLLIAGDFNMPTRSTIYRESWGEYANAFSDAGWGFGHTARVEQGGFVFTSRVDHALASDHWVPSGARVGQDLGSDHRPLIATFRVRHAGSAP